MWCTDDKFSNFYIQDIRISKKAVYTDCFRVPEKLHSFGAMDASCDEVLLHVQSDTLNANDKILDHSRLKSEFTKHGEVIHSSGETIYGNSSLYFDGVNDAISLDKADHIIGDFTFESWINLKSIPAISDFTLPTEVSDSLIDEELLIISESTELTYTDDRISALTENTITLTEKSGSDFKVNQRILIISTYGENVDTIGNFEFVEIDSINENVLTLKSNIQKNYDVADYTFVVGTKRYNKIILNKNVNVSCIAWSNSSTNIQGLVLLSANEIEVNGQIHATNRGFRGGNSGFARNGENATTSEMHGGAGETFVAGKWNVKSTQGEYGAGGGGFYKNSGNSTKGDVGTSGAGAGHGRSGSEWFFMELRIGNSRPALGGIAVAMNLNTIKNKVFMGPRWTRCF